MTHYLNVFSMTFIRTSAPPSFSLAAGCATTTGSTLARLVEPDAQQARDELGFEPVSYRHSGDLLRAPVRHVNPALDVRPVLPIAVKQQLAMIAGAFAGANADWRLYAADPPPVQPAGARHVHHAGYYHHEYPAASVHPWAVDHSFLRPVS